MKPKVASIILGTFMVFSVIAFYAGYKNYLGGSSNTENTALPSEVYYIAQSCQNLCYYAKYNLSINLSSQCLSDPETVTGKYWPYDDWVCDVAHWPRLPEDNDPNNQCKEFGTIAHNFVEVNPDCQVIRIYYNGKIINLGEYNQTQ